MPHLHRQYLLERPCPSCGAEMDVTFSVTPRGLVEILDADPTCSCPALDAQPILEAAAPIIQDLIKDELESGGWAKAIDQVRKDMANSERTPAQYKETIEIFQRAGGRLWTFLYVGDGDETVPWDWAMDAINLIIAEKRRGTTVKWAAEATECMSCQRKIVDEFYEEDFVRVCWDCAAKSDAEALGPRVNVTL